MSKWFTKPVDYEVKISNPPINGKYTPVHPIVSGTLLIEFQETVKNICNIKCGLTGSADILFYATKIEYGGFQTTAINRQLITQNVDFFDVYDDLPLDYGDGNAGAKTAGSTKEGMCSFAEGEKIKYNFEFEFPDDVYLPSSCANFGNIDGDISFSYELYVEIYKYGKILTTRSKKYSSFRMPVTFQSGMDPLLPKSITNLNYIQSHTFQDKVKKFYYDEVTKALIPSSLNKNHTKTKFIRQLWNTNYKSTNYRQFTKSLPISLDFSLRSAIDLSLPFSSQISLALFSDLKSVGISSNKSKDFVFNGQSTNLGLFKVESLTVETWNKLRLQCYHYAMRETMRNEVTKIHFKDLNFDVKDFQYDKASELYKKEVPIDILAQYADIDINQSLMEMLGSKSMLCSGSLPDWFGNVVTLHFIWTISDGMSQKKNFEFQTAATPDFLLGMPNQEGTHIDDSDFQPPPTYENSKDDQMLNSNR